MKSSSDAADTETPPEQVLASPWAGSHFPIFPWGAEGLSPSRSHSWAPVVLGQAAALEPLGAEETPACLSLLTSAEAASCLPDPHSCAIQLQHRPGAGCSPARSLEQREAVR